MSHLRKNPKPCWRERASIGLMTLGVGVLLAVLLTVFIAVPVFLLRTPQARAADVPAETVEEGSSARSFGR